MTRVLVTGASGFVGPHLVRRLMADGLDVVAVGRGSTSSATVIPYLRVDALPETPGGWTRLLEWTEATAVIHLAAHSHVPSSWQHPTETLMTNTVVTAALMESVRAVPSVRQILTVGSSEEYGPAAAGSVTEDDPSQPANPYALSKSVVGTLAAMLFQGDRVHWYHVRAFNHFGPGQRRGFVMADMASQVAAVEQGRAEALRIGNVDAQRDFLPVADVAAAYSALIRHSPPSGIYNVASGVARSVGEILDQLVAMARVPIPVQIDTARLRPNDGRTLVGNTDKLRRATDWHPEVSWPDALDALLDWWRRGDARW